jgi:steroid delta-isomerase-like uncharacterized protein
VSEANKALARQFYDAFNQKNYAGFDAFMANDLVDHNPLPGQGPGLKGLKDVMPTFHNGFPDLRITVEDLIAEGDKVVVRTSARGTNTGSMLGIPPSGKHVEITAIDIWRVRNGKLAEAWHVEELLQMMMQIGAVPMPTG